MGIDENLKSEIDDLTNQVNLLTATRKM